MGPIHDSAACPVHGPTSSGSARVIGRVGALAVALGIGAVLGSTAATAHADDSPSSATSTTTNAAGSDAAPRSSSATRGTRARAAARTSADTLNPGGNPGGRATTAKAASAARSTDLLTARPARAIPAVATPGAPPVVAPAAASPSALPADEVAAIASRTAALAASPVAHHEAAPEPFTPGTPAPRVRVRPSATTSSTSTAFGELKVCACKVVLRVLETIGQAFDNAEETGGTPAPSPLNFPVVEAVAEFVRRGVNQLLAIPPIGQFVSMVNEQFAILTATIVDQLTFATQEVIKCANPVQTIPLPSDLERTTIASDLNQPTDFRFLPDGRILILEIDGTLKVLENAVGAAPVTIGAIPGSRDRQVNAIELDPHFDETGYFYASYSTADSHDRLSRFTLTNDLVDPTSEVVLLDTLHSGLMHHGNTILFGPDDKLYFAMGDDSTSTNGQDLSNIYGKILRINSDGTIPEDNPFYNTPGARQEIFALGLRNPFRMTFTPTGQLLVGDVGDESWEELNNVVAGANYGWPVAEGPCDSCGYENPIYSYPHTPPPGRAGSITSVVVYNGTELPSQYQNKVYVADYTLGWINELTFDSTYTNLISQRTLDSEAGTTVQMLQGPDGNLYQLNIYPGELYRIAASDGNRAPTAMITATPSSGYSPLSVQFSSAGSSDPDAGTTLTYNWDFGDGATSTAANPTRTYNVNGSYTVTLTVSDGEKTGSATQRVVVGSTPPEVQITSPIAASKYNAGDVISFSATASDAEDATLPDSAYVWKVIFHHADHIHPYLDNVVGPTGTVSLSTNDHNVATTWYELAVTVTDTSGLSTTKSVDIRPNLVTLSFGANDPDAIFTVDGIPHTGSFSQQAVVGVIRTLGASSPQTITGGQLVFNSWSDSGAQQHQITTPGTNTTYTAYFDRVPSAL